MEKFQFTLDQIENLKSWKNNLNSEIAKKWLEEEGEAELRTSKILGDEKFIKGENLFPESLDELFHVMKKFSANQNLSNQLYRNNGLEEFNMKLRDLIHGKEPFVDRVNNFFKLQSIGVQTLSQFLLAFDASEYPLITWQTKESLDISSDQDRDALSDALEEFNIQSENSYLDRTLDFLRDFIIYRSVKTQLNLEKYTQVNNLLWYEFAEEGEDEGIKSYSSVSIENDLRDFLAGNISIIEKGMTLVKKEFDTGKVGRIDLLCKDKKGFNVIIELKKGRRSDEVVGQTLRYLGWIKENRGPKVRGIIIVNEPDERLSYAVNPLNNLIQIKYYKVNFEIKDKFE